MWNGNMHARWVEFVDDLENAAAWFFAGLIAVLLLIAMIATSAALLAVPIWLILRVLAWLSGA
jgi:hypothetical protein